MKSNVRYLGMFALMTFLLSAAPLTATRVVCEPQSQGQSHPTEYWYDVTPDPGEQIRSFQVETEDQNPHDGSFWNYIQPAGWSQPTVGNGWVVWTCSGTVNCPLQQSVTYRFGFSNIHPKRWGSWQNDAPDSDANHAGESDGFGRRVHIPRKFDVDEPDDEGEDPPEKPKYLKVSFTIFDPGGMELKDFFLTKDGKPIDGSRFKGGMPGNGSTTTYRLCLPEWPNDAHLVYRWIDGAGGDTHHWIDPLVIPSQHRLYCARTRDVFVARHGNDPPVICSELPLKTPTGYECPAGSDPVVPGVDYNIDGQEDPAFGWLVEPAEDTEGDGLPDFVDNCPTLMNFRQTDTDADGLGDPCDDEPFEDVDGHCPCDGPLQPTRVWVDHAEYVDCVFQTTADLVAQGVLTSSQAADINADANANTCGTP